MFKLQDVEQKHFRLVLRGIDFLIQSVHGNCFKFRINISSKKGFSLEFCVEITRNKAGKSSSFVSLTVMMFRSGLFTDTSIGLKVEVLQLKHRYQGDLFADYITRKSSKFDVIFITRHEFASGNSKENWKFMNDRLEEFRKFPNWFLPA